MADKQTKLNEYEKILEENTFLSKKDFPGKEDSEVLLSMTVPPNAQKFPNLFSWYMNLLCFKPDAVRGWQNAYQEEDDIDLFGNDDNDKPVENKPKPQPVAPAKKKNEVIAKSIVIFDVKVYEEDQDLEALAKKIFDIKIEGLVWFQEFKIETVCYTMKKLQVSCIIEDDKVCTDDFMELIQDWEEVQSIDIVAFQKN